MKNKKLFYALIGLAGFIVVFFLNGLLRFLFNF